jgi:hypothetical protein
VRLGCGLAQVWLAHFALVKEYYTGPGFASQNSPFERSLKSSMETIIEKLKKHILENPNEEISLEVNTTPPSLLVLNEAPYFSLNLDGLYIHLECFWRAVIDSKIVFTSEDDKQMFGLKKPLNIIEAFQKSFSSKRASFIRIKNPIADLQILFEDGSSIEAFASSGGYETWSISGKDRQIICQGGGQLVLV